MLINYPKAFHASLLCFKIKIGKLCRIQPVCFMQNSTYFVLTTFSPTYICILNSVFREKKDRVIRSLEWHFLKQIFNPNKKSKRDLACSSNQIVCTQAGVIIEIQNTCRTISYFTLKTQHHEPRESKTFLSQGKCCHDCKVPQSQVLTVIKKIQCTWKDNARKIYCYVKYSL